MHSATRSTAISTHDTVATHAHPISRRRFLQTTSALATTGLMGGLSLLSGCSQAGASVSGMVLPNIADPDTPIRLDDWIGQPFLINYWASSCTTCMREMPHLVGFYEQWQQYGFKTLGVAVPWDKPELVKDVVRFYEIPFPITYDIEGRSLSLVSEFVGTPTNLLINADGYVEEEILGTPDFGAVADKLASWLDVGIKTRNNV